MDRVPNKGKISVQQLKGLNEREQFANQDLGEFDWLKGFLPLQKGTLTKAPGILHMLTVGDPTGESIFNLCQTNDSRGNIIIQTQDNVWIIPENDFFEIGNSFTLTPNPDDTVIDDPDAMPYARIVDKAALTVNGGAPSTSWGTRPLTDIVSQINADGTAASFASLATNQFTLANGVYRINGRFAISKTALDAGTDKKARVRLFNVTLGLPAWDTLANEESDSGWARDVVGNFWLTFGGHLNITAGPYTFQVEDIVSNASNMVRGMASSLGSFEIYGSIDILKSN